MMDELFGKEHQCFQKDLDIGRASARSGDNGLRRADAISRESTLALGGREGEIKMLALQVYLSV
jgi:hypothetical protein